GLGGLGGGKGGGGGGGGGAEGGGGEAGQEADGRMVGAGEEIVLAARARKHSGELAVGGGAAQRHHPAHHPQEDERESRGDVLHLEPEAGEDADTHHVGDNDRGGRDRRHRRTDGATRVCGHAQTQALPTCISPRTSRVEVVAFQFILRLFPA